MERSYNDDNRDIQAVELFVQCAMLNRMIQIDKPKSYKIEI
ncbi:MAG: hypothetical protein O4804_17130 [Trichodesmium sp. St11_bin5]|nr:hypothetical protein [Trichodesmium sp. St11_bin5]